MHNSFLANKETSQILTLFWMYPMSNFRNNMVTLHFNFDKKSSCRETLCQICSQDLFEVC